MKNLYLVSLLLLAAPCLAEEPPKFKPPIVVKPGTEFRIKAVGNISTATIRNGDLVEFAVAEDVFNLKKEFGGVDGKEELILKELLIAKNTPIFGTVQKSRSRRFPFKNGTLMVQFSELPAVDGSPVSFFVLRPKPIDKDPDGKDVNGNKADDYGIRGRKDAPNAPLVPAVASAAISDIKDDTTKDIALLSFFANNSLLDLISGSNAKIYSGEIFVATVIEPKPKVEATATTTTTTAPK